MATPDMQERFAQLVDDHKKIVYKVCTSYCRNRGDRDDLAQEIIIQLWRSFPSFDDRVSFSTWMYRVALNVAISFYRREATRAKHLAPADERLLEIAHAPDDESPGLEMLHRYIDDLDPMNKALALLYLDDYSHREIASVLGLSETNVATKIHRLKSSMKTSFAKVGMTR
ncbi:MAG: sigma-70 family RNA polymerase sigma factor [Candidatus Eremiobacteraeota bacterium]|nr:sigma-70 family RNA polymerase sigma factor [Candidatus Eremiobacteraeota bacterium]